KLPYGRASPRLWQRREVRTDRVVEPDLSPVHELHHRSGRELFGDGADPIHRALRRENVVLQIGHAPGVHDERVTPTEHPDRHARGFAVGDELPRKGVDQLRDTVGWWNGLRADAGR